MSAITRKTATIFGSGSGFQQMAQFGSLAAGGATFSTDPATIQALSAWTSGWFSAILGSNSPAIEDMNAFCYVMAYQIAYIMQAGVPAWDAGTTYYLGNMCSSGGKIYISLTNSNLNNAISSNTSWALYGSGSRSVTGTDTALVSDSMVRCDPTSASFVETLPLLSSTPLGTTITFKNVATNGNFVTLTGNGTDLIDQSNTLVLNSTPVSDAVTVRAAGTVWDII